MRWAMLVLVMLAAGCDEQPAPAPEAPPPAAPAPEPAPPTTDRLSPAELPYGLGRLAVDDVGSADPGLEPSQDALRENRDALAHHREGRFDQSLAGFERAVAASPGYPLARFNRACALTRLNRLDEAAAEMAALLREDLPTFRARLQDDDDLQALRDSAHGPRLRTTVEALSVLWREALRDGVPAYTYTTRSGGDDEHARSPQSRLRIGVYRPGARRFVAATPEVGDALGVLMDPAMGRAAVVSGGVETGDLWIRHPWPVSLALYDLGDPGTRLANAPGAEHVALPRHVSYQELRAQLVSGGLRVVFEGIEYAPGASRTVELRGAIPTRTEHGVETDRPYLVIHGEGASIVDPLPAGFAVRGGALSVPGRAEPVPLGSGHGFTPLRQVLPSPDGSRVVVVSVHYRCNDDGMAAARHAADLVDPAAGTATRLSAGPGVARAAFDRDGTLFLQAGEAVRRYAPGSTEPASDVPEGIRLAPPLAERDCSI